MCMADTSRWLRPYICASSWWRCWPCCLGAGSCTGRWQLLKVVVVVTLVGAILLLPDLPYKSSMEKETSLGTKLPRGKSLLSPGNVSASNKEAGTMHTHKDWGIIQSDCVANHDLIDTDWFKSVGDRFKDFILYRDCHYFPMVHNHPEKLESFEDATLNLLLVVKSLAENSERREAVRSTWGHERDVRLRTRTGSEIARVRTLFLLGLPPLSLVHTQKSVDLEDSVQQDILQWEFFDNFYNLTLKDMNFLRWISIYSSSRVAYVLKGDDDMFVNVDNILEYLLAAPQDGSSPLLLGSVVTDSYVVRDAGSKYFIPTAMFDGHMYPHFVSGGSYVMSREVMSRLQAVSGDVQKFPLDDVWLGMCLHRANVSLTSHQGFRTLGVPQLKSADMQVCLYRDVMSVHRFLPTQLLNMWKMFTDPTIKCTRLR